MARLQSRLTSLWYTGLQPITDTTPAIDYTFNDFGYPDQSFSATDGPTVLGFATIQFANTPTPATPLTFETTNVANKTNIVFNTPPMASPPARAVASSEPSTSRRPPTNGLASLTFNTPTGGDNNVSFVNTPPGVVTGLARRRRTRMTNVTGLGVADATVLSLNGGPGTNTLNYDAGGKTPTVTPGLLPGELLISIPGAGTVDAVNYQFVNITDVGPIVITPGPAATINTVEGFQNVNSIVGTFTAPILPLPGPPGFPASDFTATINWGDPSPDLDAGTITRDASNPSVYYIKGTHTFTENGTFTVTNTVAFAGGSYTAPVNGVPITITFGPAGPTAGTPATASVTQGPLVVSALPVVGTEGIAIAAGPIATFIDAGGAGPIGDYSASISIFNSAGTLVVGPLAAASIVQNGNAAQFTVNAPTFTLPEEGTYQVVVSVTDGGGTTPVTALRAPRRPSSPTPPLTAGAGGCLTPNTGVALPSSTVIGSFTDANTSATTADFKATIDWGDGSPNSIGNVVATATPGVFDVEGGHIYAKPGTYATLIDVTDVGGSTVTVTGSATVTDLPVTGATQNFTAVEGQSTGLFVLATFTDPNTLATVADLSAVLAVGGWGDTKPTTAGVGLVVQQIGVTPLTAATDPGDPIFEVLGSHTYAEETPAGLPDTLSVIITTSGGVVTTLTSPPGGGVTVLDAPLTSSNGTAITGIEGTATPATTLLGTFVDANPLPPQGSSAIADFTSGGGSTVVNWGDGTAPQTLTAANYTVTGSPDGVIYTVSAAHTYAEEGTYAYTVTVTDDGGSVTIFGGSAVIADAPLSPSPTQPAINTTEAAIYPFPVFAAPVFSGPRSPRSTRRQPGGARSPTSRPRSTGATARR